MHFVLLLDAVQILREGVLPRGASFYAPVSYACFGAGKPNWFFVFTYAYKKLSPTKILTVRAAKQVSMYLCICALR